MDEGGKNRVIKSGRSENRGRREQESGQKRGERGGHGEKEGWREL